jgi:hypothetical protein
MRRNKKKILDLNSQVKYLNIPWATNDSDEYIQAIDEKNDY